LTVVVVTKPFPFEGKRRMRQAVEAIDRLQETVDAVIVISNSNVLEIIPDDTSLEASFRIADEILTQVVVGMVDMFTRQGLSTVDFAEVKSILEASGMAAMGMGTGSGATAAEDASVAAMNSPLLNAPLDEAAGVLVNIVGGESLSLQKINKAARIIDAYVHEDANLAIFAQVNQAFPDDLVSVTIVATGI